MLEEQRDAQQAVIAVRKAFENGRLTHKVKHLVVDNWKA